VVAGTWVGHNDTFLGPAKFEGTMKEKLWTNTGLGTNAQTFLLVNLIVHVMNIIFNIDLIVNKLQIWYYKYYKDTQQWKMLQSDLNTLLEGPQPDPSKWYTHCLVSFSTGLFFLPITPVGIIFAILEAVIQYWVDKWMVLKVYTRPKVVGYWLPMSIFCRLDFPFLIFAIGQIIFDAVLRSEVGVPSQIILFTSLTVYATDCTTFFYQYKENFSTATKNSKEIMKIMNTLPNCADKIVDAKPGDLRRT
jgi:hypothetical protein